MQKRFLGKADMDITRSQAALHHKEGIITPDRVLDAMLAADAMGGERANSRGEATARRMKLRKEITSELQLHETNRERSANR